MAEEFQVEVYGGNWWNSPRNIFGPSLCSPEINDLASFGWPSFHDVKSAAGSTDDSVGSASDGGSVVLQDLRKPQQPMMGIGLPSSPVRDQWNQNFIQRSEDNYSENLQQNASLDSVHKVEKDWNSNRFYEDFYMNSLGLVNQSFPSKQQPLNSIHCSATNCQELSFNLPLESAPSLLQNLFGQDSQPQQLLLDDQEINYFFGTNSNEQFFTPSASNFQLTNRNNTPFWNSTAHVIPSQQSQFPPSTVNDAKNKPRKEEDRELAKKSRCNEPSLKRPRMETPSPLPTFKVRKEKLGDRITALQQLVSPFGKTDTASVLHEAIDYIKFLHDQVNVLSAQYLKNGAPPRQHQQVCNKVKDEVGIENDLSSRGLCLVPISVTFPVTAETTSDFWTPTFGGSLIR